MGIPLRWSGSRRHYPFLDRSEAAVTTTTSPHVMLADLYRRALALASEEAAQPGPTAALFEESGSLFRDGAAVPLGGASPGPNAKRLETIRERIRRITIVALRRQALAARQAWVDDGGPAAGTDAQATALIAQALTFGEAALALHRDGDPARESTRRVVAFLQSTLAIAQSPPKGRRAPHAAPEVAAVLSEPPAAQLPGASDPKATSVPSPPHESPADLDVFVAGGGPTDSETRAPSGVRERGLAATPARRRAVIPALAAIAVAGFLAGFVVAPRIWRGGASPRQEVRIVQPARLSSPAPQHNGVPAAGSAPAPATARPLTAAPAGGTSGTPSPQPKASQKTALIPTKVAIVLRSEPSGAQVFIGGVWQGATPLRLERPAGALLRLTVRRGAQVWRGTLQVGERSGQVLMIRLPDSGPVTARSTPPPPPPTPAATPAPVATAVNTRRHFEALMAQGVELYRAGWYGPAMARFRTASAVRPDAPSPYLWLARAAIKVGRTAEARRALEQVIAMAPASNAAREAQAMLTRLR